VTRKNTFFTHVEELKSGASETNAVLSRSSHKAHSCCAILQAVTGFQQERPGFDFWWTVWHWNRLAAKYVHFLLSLYHHCPTIIDTVVLVTDSATVECKPERSGSECGLSAFGLYEKF
jgi:hypothetical protein